MQDTSEGRNHPAPLLTVREPQGRYRYATEAEYMLEVDSRGPRRRSKEVPAWEFEFVRRRLVQVCVLLSARMHKFTRNHRTHMCLCV